MRRRVAGALARWPRTSFAVLSYGLLAAVIALSFLVWVGFTFVCLGLVVGLTIWGDYRKDRRDQQKEPES